MSACKVPAVAAHQKPAAATSECNVGWLGLLFAPWGPTALLAVQKAFSLRRPLISARLFLCLKIFRRNHNDGARCDFGGLAIRGISSTVLRTSRRTSPVR